MNQDPQNENQDVSTQVTYQSIPISDHVRKLSRTLRDKAAATPLAADAIILANEVANLCDFVDRLHGNVETLLLQIEDGALDAATLLNPEPTIVEKKAMEIQRETHESHPSFQETVKALFMWRDAPEERLRNNE